MKTYIFSLLTQLKNPLQIDTLYRRPLIPVTEERTLTSNSKPDFCHPQPSHYFLARCIYRTKDKKRKQNRVLNWSRTSSNGLSILFIEAQDFVFRNCNWNLCFGLNPNKFPLNRPVWARGLLTLCSPRTLDICIL